MIANVSPTEECETREKGTFEDAADQSPRTRRPRTREANRQGQGSPHGRRQEGAVRGSRAARGRDKEVARGAADVRGGRESSRTGGRDPHAGRRLGAALEGTFGSSMKENNFQTNRTEKPRNSERPGALTSALCGPKARSSGLRRQTSCVYRNAGDNRKRRDVPPAGLQRAVRIGEQPRARGPARSRNSSVGIALRPVKSGLFYPRSTRVASVHRNM